MTAVLSGPVIFIKFFSVYYKILLITELIEFFRELYIPPGIVLGHFPAPPAAPSNTKPRDARGDRRMIFQINVTSIKN